MWHEKNGRDENILEDVEGSHVWRGIFM